MLNRLPVFALTSARQAHATARNSVLTGNIANADTPGFKARDLDAFDPARALAGRSSEPAVATRPGHSRATLADDGRFASHEAATGEESPDGNTVSIEEQMVVAAQNRGVFDLASSLYAKNLAMLRIAIGKDR
ncbi:flagellar basal body rod protein FlgB [Marinivivus vitaminiproducens]|uniref:flagellar basal body rod protein FlgB n=1 Tax=Marinivivus vitaminiproducens TaxID=3035935 RepID=UPI00279CCD83|nr:flagellar basal body protein [Geminicoccaceae bacterium SCSIO 64248]